MLAMADRRGRVWASIPGLANRARVTLEEVEAALQKLLSKDKYSRTSEFEGRRIEPIDGGWRLLNHEKYRSIRDEETVKETKRNYINKRRHLERGVDKVDRCRANAEADTEAEAITTEGLNKSAWELFLNYRKKIGKPYKKVSLPSAQKKLAAFGCLQMDVVEQSIANGWTGIFPLKTGGKNGTHKEPSRAKRFSDKLDDIARRDIEQNGHTDKLG